MVAGTAAMEDIGTFQMEAVKRADSCPMERQLTTGGVRCLLALQYFASKSLVRCPPPGIGLRGIALHLSEGRLLQAPETGGGSLILLTVP